MWKRMETNNKKTISIKLSSISIYMLNAISIKKRMFKGDVVANALYCYYKQEYKKDPDPETEDLAKILNNQNKRKFYALKRYEHYSRTMSGNNTIKHIASILFAHSNKHDNVAKKEVLTYIEVRKKELEYYDDNEILIKEIEHYEDLANKNLQFLKNEVINRFSSYKLVNNAIDENDRIGKRKTKGKKK